MIWSRKPRLVVDTNVFVSGILFGGTPRKILTHVKERNVVLLISPELEHEILEKLTKFDALGELYEDMRFMLAHGALKVVPTQSVTVCRDPKDNMLLALAREGNADVLITGDRDLLVLKYFEHTAIMTPRQFLASAAKTKN